MTARTDRNRNDPHPYAAGAKKAPAKKTGAAKKKPPKGSSPVRPTK